MQYPFKASSEFQVRFEELRLQKLKHMHKLNARPTNTTKRISISDSTSPNCSEIGFEAFWY